MKLGRGATAEGQVERDPRLRLVLLFGPDAGLAHERAKALVTKVAGDAGDPFRVAEFAAASLKDAPSRLMDEAASQSLTGGRRAVWLRDAADGNAGSAVQDFLDFPMGDSLIVVEAGDLPPRSSLRKATEASPIALAVGCYHDSGEATEEVVRATLGRHGIGVSSDALAYLADRLGNDRMVSRAELDKLALYMAGRPRVELEDAVACVGDHAALSVSDAIHAAAEGDPPALDRALAAADREGESTVGIVRQALRHFQRLHLLAAAVAGGKPAGIAVAGLRPPPFKRDAMRIEKQLRLWPLPQLGLALTRLLEIEAQAKSTGFPDQVICARGLLELARMAQRQRRG